MLFLGLLALIVKVTNNKYGGKQFVYNQSQKLFFGPIIELYIQGYFEFLISSIMTIKMGNYTVVGEKISLFLASLNLLVTVLILPSLLIAI